MIVEENKINLSQLASRLNFSPNYLSQLQHRFNLLPRHSSGYSCFDEKLCIRILGDLRKQQMQGIKLSYIVSNLKAKYKLE